MSSGFSTSRTEHCRKVHRLGYHPAAIRALMLLVFNSGDTSRPRESDYHLSLFSTEDVLLFCVDRTEVLVVNITDGDPRSTACTRTFLLVDDDDSKDVARMREWNKTSLPHHCIFSSMCYDRALDWCTYNHCMIELAEEGVSFDMRDTSYPDDERGTFDFWLPGHHNVVELTLPSTTSATCLGDFEHLRGFLQNFRRLAYLDMSPMKNVTAIDPDFLRECSSLTSVDLTALANVPSIGYGFLRGCSALTSVNLTPLANVTKIGSDFLSGCRSLTSVDLTPLTNVASIRYGFLRGCSALTSVNLTPLANVTKIGSDFLSGCRSLTSVDLTPLTNVASIGYGFLRGCSALTSVNLTPLANVTKIGSDFLSGCRSLTSVDLTPLT
eukprot:PhM_4_TR18829/c2_g2_i2/m.95941